MNHIGPYLLESIRAKEDAIEVWNAQDSITGVPVLIFKPLTGDLPRWRIEGVLMWTQRVADAWVAELPFGAKPLAELEQAASPRELTAWARRMLAVLLEMEAMGLEHGRIDPQFIWAKGEKAWLAGLGLPPSGGRPDAVALAGVLKGAAGDSWPGWSYHGVIEALASGNLSLREAAERLAEKPPSGEEKNGDEYQISAAEFETGTVRIIAAKNPPSARREATAESRQKALFEDQPETSTDTADGANVTIVERAASSSAKEPGGGEAENQNGAGSQDPLLREDEKQPPQAPEQKEAEKDGPKSRELPVVTSEPGKEPRSESRGVKGRVVVQISDSDEPAFEVIEPKRAYSSRNVLRVAVLALLVLMLGMAYFWSVSRRAGNSAVAEAYPLQFRVEPKDAHAEVVLLEAPKESRLSTGKVLAIIPGTVYFDAPGVYRIQIRASEYTPQEKLLVIPPEKRVIVVRIGNER